MNCPACGTPAADGDQFCGKCGAGIAQPAVTAQGAEQTQQWSPPPTPPPAAPPPPPSSSAGLVIAVLVVGALLFSGLAIGGFFLWRSMQEDDTVATSQPTAATETSSTADTDSSDSSPIGFDTPEEAVAEAAADWVYDVLGDYGDSMEYVIGPPNSEYTDVLVVERQSDGTWLVTRSYAYDLGEIDGGVSGSQSQAPPVTQQAMTAEEEATQIVGEFLYAVKQDRATDAHAYTISPFSEDPASAQYSNGDLKSIEVLSATLQGDQSTVWVRSREAWAWGTEEWIYVCVPTGSGYRISELRSP